MQFYLGTHKPHWLELIDIPLFVSRRRMPKKKLPRALGLWGLDSGGFTELNMYGYWQTSPAQYVDEVRRFQAEIGSLVFASPQDWMCEPILLKKTQYNIRQHQTFTINSYTELMSRDSSIPWIPVIQGWELKDYLNCVEEYARRGVDLRRNSLVGVGSVCRRQHTAEIGEIFKELSGLGLKLHGFGVKTLGLGSYSQYLSSSDSLAWSFHARRRPPLDGCRGHINCANCLVYALQWREQVINSYGGCG